MTDDSELLALQERLRIPGLDAYFVPHSEVLWVGLQASVVEESKSVERFLRDVFITRYEMDDGTVCCLEDEISIEHKSDGWLFRNHAAERLGGINLDIVECVRRTISEIDDVTRNYFFREPITIDHWILPVYQHPDWNEKKVRMAVTSAVSLDYADICKKLGEAWDNGTSRDDLYYEARPVKPDGPQLFLRYDCSVAYTCPRPPLKKDFEWYMERIAGWRGTK